MSTVCTHWFDRMITSMLFAIDRWDPTDQEVLEQCAGHGLGNHGTKRAQWPVHLDRNGYAGARDADLIGSAGVGSRSRGPRAIAQSMLSWIDPSRVR